MIDVVPIDGGYEFVGRKRLQKAIEACSVHGVRTNEWPVYDVGLAACVPLEDAITRCQKLSDKLVRLRGTPLLDAHPFISLAIGLLEDGKLFFVVL